MGYQIVDIETKRKMVSDVDAAMAAHGTNLSSTCKSLKFKPAFYHRYRRDIQMPLKNKKRIYQQISDDLSIGPVKAILLPQQRQVMIELLELQLQQALTTLNKLR